MIAITNLEEFITNRVTQKSISSKSLIVTLFGDVVSQHGESIWLGSIIDMLAPLGISERLVRTSVYRLVKENWLQVTREGRKSYYAFSGSANKQYKRSARRIYAGSIKNGDGRWLIVMPSFVSDDNLVAFKRQLRWLGFSP